VNLLEVVQEWQYIMEIYANLPPPLPTFFIYIVTQSHFHHTTFMSFILFEILYSKTTIDYRHVNLQEINNNDGSLEVLDIYILIFFIIALPKPSFIVCLTSFAQSSPPLAGHQE